MMEKMKWVTGEQQQRPMKDPTTRDRRLRHHDQGIITTTTKTTNDQNQSCFEKDLTMYGGLSWPQRNYRCSFCKKEFKSAQALGGHMNVHRRDRARLRQLSPPPLIINPNPSFSHLSSSAPPSTPHHQHHEFLLLPNMPSSSATNCYYSPYNNTKSSNTVVCRGDDGENKNKGAVLDFMNKVDARVSDNRNDFVRLDLKLGLFQELPDLDLDLELRLGSS